MARRPPESIKEVIRDFRREQVVRVARRLFGERGTTDVSMDEIAAESGVARSTVYVYFASRDELLRACLTGMYSQLLDDIARIWEQDAEPVHRLQGLVHGMLERIDEDSAFFRLALVTQGTVGEGGAAMGNELSLIGLNIARLIRDLYTEGVAVGTFRDIDPDHATAFIGQQLYGAMSVRAGEPLPSPAADSAAAICGFILHGLGAEPARSDGIATTPARPDGIAAAQTRFEGTSAETPRSEDPSR